MKTKGTIVKLLEKETGTSKAGKDWVKQTLVIDTKEDYNNIIAFEVFGTETVENLNKYNKVGQEVEVEFNIQSNEWKGKYYTSLQAWKISKTMEGVADQINKAFPPETFETVSKLDTEDKDDLPF